MCNIQWVDLFLTYSLIDWYNHGEKLGFLSSSTFDKSASSFSVAVVSLIKKFFVRFEWSDQRQVFTLDIRIISAHFLYLALDSRNHYLVNFHFKMKLINHGKVLRIDEN